jgi:hypothetical protein
LSRRPRRAVTGIPQVIRHLDCRSRSGNCASSCPTRRCNVTEQARLSRRPGRPLVESGQHGRDQPSKPRQGSARPGPKLETKAIRDASPIRKFNRTDARELILDEGSPRLCPPHMRFGHIARYGSLRHGEAELQEFAVDPWSSPKKVVSGHLGDQLTDLTCDPWAPATPTTTRSTSPDQRQSLTTPAQDCLRLNNDQALTPAMPPT